MILDGTISAVITGGASGLGEATARLLASHGVRVAICDLNVERGEAVARQLQGVFCQVDIGSESDVTAGFEKARAAIGQERILVNCAAIGRGEKTASRDRKTGAIRSHSIDVFERIILINLVGTFRCIAKSSAGMLTLPPLTDGDRGVIVNTSSGAAEDGQVG